MNFKAIFLLCFLGILVGHKAGAYSPGDTAHHAAKSHDISKKKKQAPIDTARSAKPHDITTIYTEPSMSPFNQWQPVSWTVDTSLYNFEQYTSQYNLGNTGTPNVPIIFSTQLNPLGFYYGHNYLESQLFSDSTIKYYHTRAPYTRFYYVTDPMLHQFFHLIHTQNIGKKLNVALEFQRTRAQGVYINQATNLNQLTLSANYQSKRYVLYIDGMYGTYELYQNGGITADSTLADPTYSDRGTVPVNLQYARSEQTNRSLHLKQYFFLGYHTDDSLHKVPSLYLSHSLKMSTNTNIFTDPGPLNTSYYNNTYSDTSTYDSLRYVERTNDLSIGSAKGWPSLYRWEAGVAYQWVRYKDARTDTVFNNFMAHAMLYDTGRIPYFIQAKEIVAGTQHGDVQLAAGIGIHLDSLRSIRLQGEYSAQTPPLVYDLYYGNNFRWQNNFNRTNTSSASLVYTDTKLKMTLILEATQVTNLTYFTTDGTPQQYTQGIPVLSAHFKKDFKLGKWHLTTNDIYQYVPDYTPIRLPQFLTENSIYYENQFFHKNLRLKIGVDLYYNTSYLGYAYNPVVDQFYVQNQEEIGNYPYLDPFVSFRIKTFRMFFKLENAGSGIVGDNYFYAVHYPMPDRVLRMGISWDFWN